MKPVNFDWFALYRYVTIVVLFFAAFFFMFSDKSQYMFFISIFILSLFYLWFILRDLFQNTGYMRQIAAPASQGPEALDSIFSKVSMVSLLIGGIGQLVAILILLIVFSYAQSQIKDAKSYTITLPSYTYLYNFKLCLIVVTFLLGLLTFVQAYTWASEDARRYMLSAITSVSSLGILGVMGYQLYLAVRVLDVRQKNLLLYNVSE